MSSRMVTTSIETIFAALLRNEISPDGERHICPVPEFPEFPPPEPPRRDEHGHRPIGPVDEWEEPPEPRDPTDAELSAFAYEWIEEVCQGGDFDLLSPTAYAEPGYRDPKKAILLADWNRVSRTSSRWLEAAGYALEWSDEWSECGDCYRAVRTQGDSYSWKRSYAILDGEICCADCVAKGPGAYLASLRGDAGKVHTLDTVNLAKHGYVKVSRDFENGFHRGQDDSPNAIAAVLAGLGVEDFIFSLDGVGQFDVRFSLWLRPADAPHATFGPGEGKARVSPADAMECALRDAPAFGSVASSVLGESGITYTNIAVTDDGATVTTRKISHEEFVAGILAPHHPHTHTKE
jgi:hypothetical protein